MKVVISVLLLCLAVAASAAPALPSRDAHTVLPLLKKLLPPPKITTLEEIMGPRDQDIGSGIYVLIYRLSDDSVIAVGSSDGKVALWIKRSTDRGGAEMIFDSEREPNQVPEPTSGSVAPRAASSAEPTEATDARVVPPPPVAHR